MTLVDDLSARCGLFRTRVGRRVVMTSTPPAPRVPTRRPAKAARMLALAHHLDGEVLREEVRSRSALARRHGVSAPRITQLLNLLLLAPDIQADVLELEAIDGVEPITEKELRPLARLHFWPDQRALWAARKNSSRALSRIRGPTALVRVEGKREAGSR